MGLLVMLGFYVSGFREMESSYTINQSDERHKNLGGTLTGSSRRDFPYGREAPTMVIF